MILQQSDKSLKQISKPTVKKINWMAESCWDSESYSNFEWSTQLIFACQHQILFFAESFERVKVNYGVRLLTLPKHRGWNWKFIAIIKESFVPATFWLKRKKDTPANQNDFSLIRNNTINSFKLSHKGQRRYSVYFSKFPIKIVNYWFYF